MTILRLAYIRLGVVFSFFIGLLSILHLVRENSTNTLEREPAAQPVAPPHLTDAGDGDPEEAVQEKQVAQQAPPPASMPIGNRYIYAQPQNYHQWAAQDDNWWMGMPLVLRARAMLPAAVAASDESQQLALPLGE
jgi:hypothetical protein